MREPIKPTIHTVCMFILTIIGQRGYTEGRDARGRYSASASPPPSNQISMTAVASPGPSPLEVKSAVAEGQ